MKRQPAGRVLVGVLAGLLAGCVATAAPSSGPTLGPLPSPSPTTSSAASATPEATASAQPSASQRPGCPNAGGGTCLGILNAGTYSTATFSPPVTFTVPVDGWANDEDQDGNVLLVPPGYDQAGVDLGTSDYVGIYSSLAPIASCDGSPATIKGASAMATYLSKQPALATTKPLRVAVGGLSGFMLDVRIAKGWKGSCSGNGPDSGVIAGLPPSEFEHGVGGKLAMRIYLLDDGDHVVGIEVDDISGGSHLAGYDSLIASLQFGPG